MAYPGSGAIRSSIAGQADRRSGQRHTTRRYSTAEMTKRTSLTHPIRVDFAPSPAPHRRLGMTFAPGKFQVDGHSGSWDRDLVADLKRLHYTFKTDVLVSLIEESEL